VLILGLDTETSGLDAEEHRIIEFCGVLYNVSTRKPVKACVERIYPDRAIDPKAQMVHGISIEQLVGKPRFNVVAPKIAALLEEADTYVAHNLEFDMSFLVQEFLRIGKMPNWNDKRTFCTMLNGRWATATGKVPNLQELCFACDVDYDTDKAHAAVYDVSVMMKCLWRGIDEGFFDLGS
jgi:DNA polymerase-3 subunit epsilon